MAEILTTEPTSVTAGDTITWKQSLSDYPASAGWTLKYALRASAGKIDISSTADGDDHIITVTAATSSAWTAATYPYQKYVEKGSGPTIERVTIDTGELVVKASLAAMSTATDTRTWARKCLDAIEAVIEGRATRSDLEYQITLPDGTRQQLSSMTIKDLLAARDDFAYRVATEQSSESLFVPVRTVFV